MPEYPEIFREWKLDPHGNPSGRFAIAPAIAISTGEYGEGDDALAEKVIRESVGDWLLDEQPLLGKGKASGGSAGRGAAGWVAVAHWLADAIANNIVDVAVGAALARTLEKLHHWRRERAEAGKHGGIEVSRGAAALVAAADVVEHFDERGPIEVEAVEEPSSIAGAGVTELSYVGIEPWIVLLRNVDAEVRYIIVVNPDGEVLGRLRIPFQQFERLFLHPSSFSDPPRFTSKG